MSSNSSPPPPSPHTPLERKVKRYTFYGIGQCPEAIALKRKLAEEQQTERETERSNKPRKKLFSISQLERPANLSPIHMGPGSLYNLLIQSEINHRAASENNTADSSTISPSLDNFFNSKEPWPAILQSPRSPTPELTLPSPPSPRRARPLYPSSTRLRQYEFGRAPQLLKKSQRVSAKTKKTFRIVNPFLPHYAKINGERIPLDSDSEEVEEPNSFRNQRRRRFFRAVILQEMMWHRLFPAVQTELMRRPMQQVLQELKEMARVREYVQLYVLPHIRGCSFRPVLNHLVFVRGRLPHHFQGPIFEGPSTFDFLIYTSFPEGEQYRQHGVPS